MDKFETLPDLPLRIEHAAAGKRFGEVISEQRLRKLYTYWTEVPRSGALPGRHEIDPLHFCKIWPNVMLADIVTTAGRVRYRVVGTDIVQNWGNDFTGRGSEDVISGVSAELVAALYAMCIRHRGALYAESKLRWDANDTGLLTRRLILPLARDGSTVDMVLVGQTFHRSSKWAEPGELRDVRDPYKESVVWIEDPLAVQTAGHR